jgi:hypothetical protein
VLEQDGLDELLDHCLLGGVEVGGGLEGEPEIVAGPALVLGEFECVGADIERYRYVAEPIEGGCAVPVS